MLVASRIVEAMRGGAVTAVLLGDAEVPCVVNYGPTMTNMPSTSSPN